MAKGDGDGEEEEDEDEVEDVDDAFSSWSDVDGRDDAIDGIETNGVCGKGTTVAKEEVDNCFGNAVTVFTVAFGVAIFVVVLSLLLLMFGDKGTIVGECRLDFDELDDNNPLLDGCFINWLVSCIEDGIDNNRTIVSWNPSLKKIFFCFGWRWTFG